MFPAQQPPSWSKSRARRNVLCIERACWSFDATRAWQGNTAALAHRLLWNIRFDDSVTMEGVGSILAYMSGFLEELASLEETEVG